MYAFRFPAFGNYVCLGSKSAAPPFGMLLFRSMSPNRKIERVLYRGENKPLKSTTAGEQLMQATSANTTTHVSNLNLDTLATAVSLLEKRLSRLFFFPVAPILWFS